MRSLRSLPVPFSRGPVQKDSQGGGVDNAIPCAASPPMMPAQDIAVPPKARRGLMKGLIRQRPSRAATAL